ncbi:DUF6114 domain-containing protein [Nocardioides sp. QY071]|uniref:DUF6114 domain-containing protein n=1 Tax=Nocardioides sp. QY071 TaxID=3044187 RepID=UPI00249A3D30|nr:DUF6114 domain-containing protein [Nocardioides sp. QY071]WGY01429.1 DUF6114 domain-containing protein [Nocardioides sp. QY071]
MSAPTTQVRRRLGAARRALRGFRRTRPFWGGLWCILAGAWIIRAMFFSFLLAVSGGWSYSAGYILGGGLVLFGLVAWFAPHYRGLVGLLAVGLALAAFVAANLGGYLVGSVLGILGGSMVWAWGEKAPRRARGGRRRAVPAS